MRPTALVLVLLLAVLPAAARQEDGLLGLIQRPNNGVPALVLPGGQFDARLGARAELAMEGPQGRYPLEATWTLLPGGQFQARCTIPEAAPPGTYALAATSDQGADNNLRSLYVFEAFPEYYTVAHVSDTHLGKVREGKRPPLDVNTELFTALNDADAHLVLVTGDLTEGGRPEEFRRLLGVLDRCAAPTFVCPGNHDRNALHYERFFGPCYYRFRFGQDGYLAFDTKDFVTADELGPQDGFLQRARRELKACRFTIGFTHRYEPTMGMRSQLSLFVDNPLDLLLAGHWHRENTAEERALPWGKTALSVVPAAVDGYARLLDMTAKGLIPRPVAQFTSVGPQEPPAPIPPSPIPDSPSSAAP